MNYSNHLSLDSFNGTHQAGEWQLRTWLPVILLGIAFFAIDQDPRFLEAEFSDDAIYATDERAESIEQGNSVRRVAFLALGVLGGYLCLQSRGRPLKWRDPALLACGGLFAWYTASLFWSVESELTARRITTFLCVFLAALGLARQLAALAFARALVALTATYLAFAFAIELATGHFRPWSEGYRFAGMVHPNNLAVCCSFLCLAALALLRSGSAHRLLLGFAIGAGACGLLLTRSRTALVALLAALLVSWLIVPGRRALPWALAALMVACVAAVAIELSGSSVEETVAQAALMGRTEESDSLTGRLPLWIELLDFATERPWAGYGYGAFWNPERTEDFSKIFYWPIPDAHSAYMDAVIAVGLIGVGMLAVTLSLAIGRFAARYRRTLDPGYGLLLALVTFAAVNAFTESDLLQPSFIALVTLCAIFQLPFGAGEEGRAQSDPVWHVVRGIPSELPWRHREGIVT